MGGELLFCLEKDIPSPKLQVWSAVLSLTLVLLCVVTGDTSATKFFLISGFAPAVGAAIGAVGTISQMSSQRRQAAAQREQIEAAKKANQEMYTLNLQRYEYARNEANASYLREKIVTDQMHRNAVTNLGLAQAQQSIANTQQLAQQQQFSANLENQINQLVGAGANVETQGALQQNQALAALAGSFGQAEQDSKEFIQRLVLSGQNPAAAQQVLQDFMLQQIYNNQQTQQAVNTVGRVTDAQTQFIASQAANTERYREAVNSFLSGQQQINQRFQSFANQTMPSLLDIQNRRNQVQLEAAKLAKLSEIEMGEQTNRIQFENNQQVSQAQIKGVGGNGTLQGLASLASQTVPFILDAANNRQPQTQYSFAGPALNIQRASPSQFTAPVGGLNFNQGVITDITGGYYG